MREKIEAKIKELKMAKDKFIGQVNALNGAIQVLEELMMEESLKEKPKEETDGKVE